MRRAAAMRRARRSPVERTPLSHAPPNLQPIASSTIPISSSVSPYNSYPSRSICRSVASICRWSNSLAVGILSRRHP